jgi:hypothetical protein
MGVQAQSQEDMNETIAAIYHGDSLFWEAYNACDINKMQTFFTDDIEFYHDKGGLTSTREALVETIKKGLCGNPNWHLRREAVAGTVKIFPLNNYGGLISGEHIFFITDNGNKEYLDGHSQFLQIWRLDNNEWKMSRILSYDHKPAVYKSNRKEVQLPDATLKQYAGTYTSASTGKITVTKTNNLLSLTTGDLNAFAYAEKENIFFLKERDVQIEFVKNPRKKVEKLIVFENGVQVDEALRSIE